MLLVEGGFVVLEFRSDFETWDLLDGSVEGRSRRQRRRRVGGFGNDILARLRRGADDVGMNARYEQCLQLRDQAAAYINRFLLKLAALYRPFTRLLKKTGKFLRLDNNSSMRFLPLSAICLNDS